jgi:hypothetical protein
MRDTVVGILGRRIIALIKVECYLIRLTTSVTGRVYFIANNKIAKQAFQLAEWIVVSRLKTLLKKSS